MRPDAAYAICTLPRSGSYLLSEALASTELAGYPAEYLNQNHDDYFRRLLGERKFADYSIVFDTMLRVGTTQNGMFAIKVLWFHLEEMRRRFAAIGQFRGHAGLDIFRGLMPPTRYVRLIRRNKLRQAISYMRAARSKIWYVSEDAAERPVPADSEPLDIEKLHKWKGKLEAWEGDWDNALAGIGAEVLTLYYEDVEQDLDQAVRQVHDFIDVSLPAGFQVPQPSLRRQSDALTERWEAAYHDAMELVMV